MMKEIWAAAKLVAQALVLLALLYGCVLAFLSLDVLVGAR